MPRKNQSSSRNRKQNQNHNQSQNSNNNNRKNQISKQPQGKNFHLELLNQAQKEAWSAFQENDVIFLIGAAGTGKTLLSTAFAIKSLLTNECEKIVLTRPIVESGESLGFLPGPQPLDAKILTPQGWITMGEVKIGTEVIGRDGKPTKVLKIFPKGKKLVYKITTTDGLSTECCEDHLWLTSTRKELKNNHSTVKSTKEIMRSLQTNKGKTNHFIPRNKAVQFEKTNFTTHPFSVGASLNNTSLRKSENANIFDENQNSNLITKIKHSTIHKILTKTGITKSSDQYIPDSYKFASIQDRIDLLQGILNINTITKKNGTIVFYTTSSRLANDVSEVVRSLGGRAILSQKTLRKTAALFNVKINLSDSISPFKTNGKSCNIDQIGIKSIEAVCEKEVQCILVENSEHLYLTDNFIVTHNTFEEKVNPYMMPVYDCIDKLIGREGPNKEKILQNTEIAPIAYMRGRSFNDSVCIFDEAQNASMTQLKLFLTRFGQNTKVVITGDPDQSDLHGPVALSEIIRKLEGVPGIATIYFDNSSIVRNKLIADILDRLGE